MLETPASLSFYGGNLALINLLGSKLSFLFCLFYFFFDNTGKEVVRCRRKAARSQRKINSRCYGWCSITNQYIPIRGKSVFLSYSNKLKNNKKLQNSSNGFQIASCWNGALRLTFLGEQAWYWGTQRHLSSIEYRLMPHFHHCFWKLTLRSVKINYYHFFGHPSAF